MQLSRGYTIIYAITSTTTREGWIGFHRVYLLVQPRQGDEMSTGIVELVFPAMYNLLKAIRCFSSRNSGPIREGH